MYPCVARLPLQLALHALHGALRRRDDPLQPVGLGTRLHRRVHGDPPHGLPGLRDRRAKLLVLGRRSQRGRLGRLGRRGRHPAGSLPAARGRLDARRVGRVRGVPRVGAAAFVDSGHRRALLALAVRALHGGHYLAAAAATPRAARPGGPGSFGVNQP
eukprot:6700205-Prymnesium_polylepis.1